MSATSEVVPADFSDIEDRFVVRRTIGHGAFSVVYEAERRTTLVGESKTVALKRMAPTCKSARIVHEIRLLRQLGGQSHVLGVEGVVRHEDQYTLVLPYHAHQSFRSYFTLLSVDEVRHYMRQLMTSLAHIHSHGVVHRDVKPGNCLYNPETQEFMLIDFGLAQRVDACSKPVPVSSAATAALPTPASASVVASPAAAAAATPVSSRRARSASRPALADITAGTGDHTGASGASARSVGVLRGAVPPRAGQGSHRRLRLLSQVAERAGTRGFRAPEVLLRSRQQGTPLDVWSAGCILLSFVSERYPAFRSPGDMESLVEIAVALGSTRIEAAATALGKHVAFHNLAQVTPDGISFRDIASRSHRDWPDDALDLLARCLEPNPRRRITAEEALRHPFLAGLSGIPAAVAVPCRCTHHARPLGCDHCEHVLSQGCCTALEHRGNAVTDAVVAPNNAVDPGHSHAQDGENSNTAG